MREINSTGASDDSLLGPNASHTYMVMTVCGA